MNGINWFKGGNTPSGGGGETRRSNALRVFIVVAALHAVVLGPILLFEGCKSGSANTAANNTENTDPVPPPQEIIAAPVQTVPPPPAIPSPAPAAPLQPTPPAAAAPAPPQPAAPLAAKTYKVVAGDSLWRIAKNERVSVAELMRANNLTDKSVLRVGQTLQIPAPSASTAPAAASTPTAAIPAGATEYVVKSGDSLWEIARKHNTTVNALKEANKLTSTTLRIGQKLIIPAGAARTVPMGGAASVADPIAGGTVVEGGKTYHFVGFNEPLEAIAKRYGVSQKAIIEANRIQNANAIRAGDRLLIPTSTPTPAPAPATPEAAVPPPPPLG